MEIHIRRNGKSTGPYSLDEVRAALARTEISLDDQAWHRGLSGWTSLKSIVQSPEGNEPNVTHAEIEGLIATSAPPARPKKRVGCCGIIVLGLVALAALSSILAGDWIKEGDELHGDTAEVGITIDVPKKLYAQSGVMTLATDNFCLSAANVGERAWKAAHRHSAAKKVLLHVYANKPAATDIDRYGKESSTDRESHFLGDITVVNLDEVRRYQDAQHYALHDDAVNTWYRQRLEPMFTNKSPAPASVTKSQNESVNRSLIPESSQAAVQQQTAPKRWLTYGQNVSLHGVLVRQYHTEWLDMLSDSAEAQKRAKTPAYILRLTSPISARNADPNGGLDDAEQNEHEVYLSSLPDGAEKWIDTLIGRQVTAVGKLDHAFSVHHMRPVMIDASAVSIRLYSR